MKYVVRLSMALALCAAINACGDDDDDMAASGTGGTTAAGTGGTSGGSGGTGGTGGTSGGTGGTGSTGSVQCGSQSCTVQGIASMFGAQACCFDEAASTCGTSMGGGECMGPRDPGTPDERCTPDMGGSPFPLSGCCINDMCGVDLSLFQQGCVEYSELSQLAGMFGGMSGGLFTVPDPRRCDAPPPTDEDAGI